MMRDAGYYAVNPWERLSATRVNTFRRCPRWYHWKYREWHQTPRTAIMRAGNAVQRAFERLVMGTPSEREFHLVRRAAGERLWAFVEEEAAKARREHETDLGSAGPWDIAESRLQAWAVRALDIHWRYVMKHAAPDMATAWEAARPQLFDDPIRGDGEFLVIPDGWFQYQPDAVYTEPSGARVLVDLKIGKGSEPYLTENREQLRMYAWAEEQAGRSFDRLELWFLGREEPVDVVERWLAGRSDPFVLAAGRIGRSDSTPTPGETWCAKCPFAEVCDASAVKREPVQIGLYSPWDDADNGCRLSDIPARVIGIGEPKQKRGKLIRRITLANSSGMRTYGWDERDIDRLGIRVGKAYTFAELKTWTCRYRGAQLDIDRISTVEEIEQVGTRGGNS